MNTPTSNRDAIAPAADADEHAFEKFAQEHDPLDLDAATWAVRRGNGLNAEGQVELQAWLDADPRHAAALEGMAATVGQVRQMSGDDVAALKLGLQKDMPTRSAAVRAAKMAPAPLPCNTAAQPRPERRGWRASLGPLFAPAAVAVLVVAVVGSGWAGWQSWRSLPTYEQAFATERGRQIVATLPDDPTRGSTLQLDTATRLEARLYRSRREVHLTEGQALFSVHSDKDRPFHVWAGNLHITVVGTRFSVRHTRSGLDAGRTVVSVEEGHVRVTRAAPDSQGRRDHYATSTGTTEAPVDLVAGQMVVGDDNGIGPVTRVSAAAIASWRSGRISFDNTPLAQALAEFERYRNTGLVIKDPAVAKLLVGGSYSLQQFGRFTDALPLVLPVRLVRQGDVTEIVLREP